MRNFYLIGTCSPFSCTKVHCYLFDKRYGLATRPFQYIADIHPDNDLEIWLDTGYLSWYQEKDEE